MLLSADRAGTVEIMRRTGKAKPSVWRWQARYLGAGVDGLLYNKSRPRAFPGWRRSWSNPWLPAR